MSINTGNLSLFRFPVFFMLFSENPDYDIIGALSEVFSSLVRVMLCIIGALSEVFSSLVLPGVF